jgi:hypothetical protein
MTEPKKPDVEPYTRIMRVCEQCKSAYWHPLNYCLKCPGKIQTVAQQVSGDITIKKRHTYYNERDYEGWLEKAGLKDGGI